MSLQSSLCAYIETKSAITDIIGTSPCRFFPQIVKGSARNADGSISSCAVYSRSSVKRFPTTAGSSGALVTVVRIVSFAQEYGDAVTLANQFRVALDGKKGTVGDQHFGACLLIDESDNIDPVEFAQNDAPHFVAQEYQITHHESAPTL
jgi:hypothetical protein